MLELLGALGRVPLVIDGRLVFVLGAMLPVRAVIRLPTGDLPRRMRMLAARVRGRRRALRDARGWRVVR
jgi:hypothetical protein